MNILISAFNVSPNTGSYMGFGWSWIESLPNNNKYIIVTNKKYKNQILSYKKPYDKFFSNKNFLFFEIENINYKNIYKKRTSTIYYILWQFKLIFEVKKILKKNKIDLIHHLTITSIRLPSFLFIFKNVDFCIGPLGGGENINWRFRKNYSFRGYMTSFLRDISNSYIKYSVIMNLIFFFSKKILLRTEEAKKCLLKYHHEKVDIFPYQQITKIETKKSNFISSTNNKFNILYVGRILHWKGLYLSLLALKKMKNTNNLIFHIVGDGHEKKKLDRYAEKLGVRPFIRWYGNIPRQDLYEFYRKSDLFLFLSYHDSGGLVLREAATFKLPIICLESGGPAYFINKYKSEQLIEISNKSYSEVVMDVASKITYLRNNKKIRKKIGLANFNYFRDLNMILKINNFYKKYYQN